MFFDFYVQKLLLKKNLGCGEGCGNEKGEGKEKTIHKIIKKIAFCEIQKDIYKVKDCV